MAAGYVYVLVNSSMPGLLKVGKTSRLPSERESELSGVTGVPTPFVVAFEQFFTNCDLAEDFVHAALELRGLRQATNREFFRAATNDVIRIILQAPGAADGPEDTDDIDSDLLSPTSPDDEWKLEGRKPWDGILEEADAYYYGEEDSIQDYEEALKSYKQAARLGSSLAYARIGDIYYFGEGVNKDEKLAFNYYKEGAKRGNYYCYLDMALIFKQTGQIDNYKKVWRYFFSERKNNYDKHVEEYSTKFVNACTLYIIDTVKMGIKTEFSLDMRPIAHDIYCRFQKKLSELGRFDDERWVFSTALKWVIENLPGSASASSLSDLTPRRDNDRMGGRSPPLD